MWVRWSERKRYRTTFPPSTLHSTILLHRAQLHSDNQLGLGRHVLEDVSLQPPQHVRSQQVVELLDLVLLRDVSKLFQKALKITAERERQDEGLSVFGR